MIVPSLLQTVYYNCIISRIHAQNTVEDFPRTVFRLYSGQHITNLKLRGISGKKVLSYIAHSVGFYAAT